MNRILNRVDVERFKELIDKSSHIVLTCHVRPDGDAVGSTLGLKHLLAGMGKDVHVVLPDQAPKSLAFLPGFKEMCVYTRHEDYSRRLINDADLIICCDFNKLSRQDRLGALTGEAKCSKVLIDHHLYPDDFCDITFSYPEMSSASELAFRLVAAMGLYVDMSLESATCLLTGIITDTRNFSVNCSNPEIYEILMRLLEKGCDKERIVKEALETHSLNSVKLHAYAISEKMEIFERHHVAVITLNKEELKRFGYERGDTEGLVNEPLGIRGVVASFFLREDDDCIKVSSRSTRKYPVSQVCEDLYGG
ncbi:MAG: DHH family phosphoesterase, partial [Muribaculaceae bacterium]|nr:DHH family phosphoesterase [Muribaculaceae bacterium]